MGTIQLMSSIVYIGLGVIGILSFAVIFLAFSRSFWKDECADLQQDKECLQVSLDLRIKEKAIHMKEIEGFSKDFAMKNEELRARSNRITLLEKELASIKSQSEQKKELSDALGKQEQKPKSQPPENRPQHRKQGHRSVQRKDKRSE